MVGHENLGLAILVRVQTSQLINGREPKGCGERFSPRFRGDREGAKRLNARGAEPLWGGRA